MTTGNGVHGVGTGMVEQWREGLVLVRSPFDIRCAICAKCWQPHQQSIDSTSDGDGWRWNRRRQEEKHTHTNTNQTTDYRKQATGIARKGKTEERTHKKRGTHCPYMCICFLRCVVRVYVTPTPDFPLWWSGFCFLSTFTVLRYRFADAPIILLHDGTVESYRKRTQTTKQKSRNTDRFARTIWCKNDEISILCF